MGGRSGWASDRSRATCTQLSRAAAENLGVRERALDERSLERARRADQPGETAPGEEPPRPRRAPLVLRSSDGRHVLPLEPGQYGVGRSGDNAIVLLDRGVSARHCLIDVREGGAVKVFDCESRNGTLVNGVRVTIGELAPGSELQIGCTRFVAALRGAPPPSSAVIGDDPGLERALEHVRKVAPFRASVLVHGESGTGKELVARAIHAQSDRTGRAFVVLNCGAIARELAESELFGHERGAFTGALARRAGAFEEADGGTLFLDEIGELQRGLQPKLLRALESGEVRPLGAPREVKVDVRLVCATHRDLPAEIERGRFRLDLYHRLAHVTIELPPLRERRGDVPALVQHFLGELETVHGPRRIAPATMQALCAHDWPGNVRELRAAVMRAMLLDPAELRLEHLLPRPARPSAAPPSPAPAASSSGATLPLIDIRGRRWDDIESAVLCAVLDQCQGNRRLAAERLGLPKSTLADKLRRHGL